MAPDQKRKVLCEAALKLKPMKQSPNTVWLKSNQYAKRFFTADLKALFKDSSWTIGNNLISNGLYLVEMMLLTRYLPPQLLGIYFLIISFPELIQQILDIRVKELMIRYLSLFIGQNEPRKALSLIKMLWFWDVGIAMSALLIVALFSQIASNVILGESGFASLMILYSLGMFFGSLDSASGPILRVFGRFDLAFWAGAFISLSSIISVSFVVFFDGGLKGLIFSKVFVSILSTVALGILSLRMIRQKLGTDFFVPLNELQDYKREMLGFAFHINVSSTIKALTAKLDVIIVGVLLGSTSVAIYKVSTQLAKTLYLLNDPLGTAIYPRFSLLSAQGKVDRINALVKRVMVGLSIGAGLLIIFTYILREQIVGAYAGEDYIQSAMIFVVASWGIVPGIILFWVKPYLLSLDLAYIRTKSIFVGNLMAIIIFCILTLSFGLMGAVIGFGLISSLAVMLSLFLIFLWRRKSS